VSTISNFMPPPDGRPLAVRPSETANQRDSWLRQMELGLVAEMNQAHAHAASPAAARPAVQPLQPVLPPASRPAPQMAGGQAPAAPAQCHDRSVADGVPAGTPAGAADGPVQGAMPAQQLAMTTAARPVAARAGEQVLAETTAALSRQLRLQLAAFVSQKGAALAEDPGSAAPQHGEAAAGEAPAWEERKIHFTGQGQDVDVWIRDSALTAPSSATVLAQLAQEMAGMGLRMKNVTINGKLVETDGKTSAAEQQPRINHPENTHGTR